MMVEYGGKREEREKKRKWERGGEGLGKREKRGVLQQRDDCWPELVKKESGGVMEILKAKEGQIGMEKGKGKKEKKEKMENEEEEK